MALSLLKTNLKLDDNEYCYSLQGGSSAGSIAMNMPKLMSGISTGMGSSVSTFNPNTIFCNAKECPHGSGNMLKSKNFLMFQSAEPARNITVNLQTLKDQGVYHKTYPAGTRFVCQVMNGNVDKLYFIP